MRYLLKTRILITQLSTMAVHMPTQQNTIAAVAISRVKKIPLVKAATHPYLLFKTSNHNMPFEEIIKLIKIGSTTVVKTNTTIK